MKSKTMMAAGICLLMAGCATQVAKLPVTPRDAEVYDNPYLKGGQKQEGQSLRVAVIPQHPQGNAAVQPVPAQPIPGQIRGGGGVRTLQGGAPRPFQGGAPRLPQGGDPISKQLSDSFGGNLEAAISNLADFKVVPRAELGALISDDAMANLGSGKQGDYKIENVDFVLVYNISNYALENVGKDALGGKKAPDMYRGVVKATVSLINKGRNEKEFSNNLQGYSLGRTKNQNPGVAFNLLAEAADAAVKDFVNQFAVDYAPPATVQQTKGGGQVALLNLGKNYGLASGMKMEFFFYKEKDGKRQVIPFAYGKVIELGADTCWVEVDDFEKAGVMENHFARVRKDQSKTFLENLAPKAGN